MKIHRVFDVVLASDFPFRNRLESATPPVDLTFECRADAGKGFEGQGLEPAYVSSRRTASGESIAYLFRLETRELLRFTGVSDFYVGDERIECHLLERGSEPLVEIQLLGSILSYWLERRGIATLHASAVDAGGRAVGFLSSNSGGKTGLAAAMMRLGCPLLTDDVLPVEPRNGAFFGRPGYPQLRMWSDEAEHFLGRSDHLEIVHPEHSKRRVPMAGLGGFCSDARPLSRLYLLQRRPAEEPGTAVEVRRLSPRDAVIELVRHSFSPFLVEALGWQSRRLDQLTRLVERVPVSRLLYPAGFDRLPEVCDRVLRDLG